VADVESEIEQGNGIDNPECQQQWIVSATQDFPELIWATVKSKRQVDKC
jgi:hypothetical protein